MWFPPFFHPYGQIRFPSQERASSFCTFQRGHIWPIFGEYSNIRFDGFPTFKILFWVGTTFGFFLRHGSCFWYIRPNYLTFGSSHSPMGPPSNQCSRPYFATGQKMVDVRQYSDSKAKVTKRNVLLLFWLPHDVQANIYNPPDNTPGGAWVPHFIGIKLGASAFFL